jgi:hypothetical protein
MISRDDQRMSITIRLVGGPTTLTGVGSLRLLGDPTFDSPGTYPIPTTIPR